MKVKTTEAWEMLQKAALAYDRDRNVATWYFLMCAVERWNYYKRMGL